MMINAPTDRGFTFRHDENKKTIMNDATIAETVNSALAEEFEIPAEKLVPEAHIRDDLGLDSLDIVDMVIVLEKAFAFRLPNREALAHIQTLGDIHAFIRSMRDSGVIETKN